MLLPSEEASSVILGFPLVGWERTVEQLTYKSALCAWLLALRILLHPGHFTSMKEELGLCTRHLLYFLLSPGKG